MLGRPAGFGVDQFEVECNCDPARDLAHPVSARTTKSKSAVSGITNL
jgi:hypothetical protein